MPSALQQIFSLCPTALLKCLPLFLIGSDTRLGVFELEVIRKVDRGNLDPSSSNTKCVLTSTISNVIGQFGRCSSCEGIHWTEEDNTIVAPHGM
jgi:hypothetical protein